MPSGWSVSNPVHGQRADRAPVLLAPIVSADEYLVVLVNAGRFEWLRRKDDLLDEGVAAVFGMAGGTAELLGLCFHRRKFPPDKAKAWLAERGFTPPADVPIMRRQT